MTMVTLVKLVKLVKYSTFGAVDNGSVNDKIGNFGATGDGSD